MNICAGLSISLTKTQIVMLGLAKIMVLQGHSQDAVGRDALFLCKREGPALRASQPQSLPVEFAGIILFLALCAAAIYFGMKAAKSAGQQVCRICPDLPLEACFKGDYFVSQVLPMRSLKLQSTNQGWITALPSPHPFPNLLKC